MPCKATNSLAAATMKRKKAVGGTKCKKVKWTVNDVKAVAVMKPPAMKRPSTAFPKQSCERSRARPLLSVLYMIEQAIDFVENAFRNGRLHGDDAYIILVELAAASKLASEGKLFGESATHKVRASRMIARVMARRRAGRHGCCHGA